MKLIRLTTTDNFGNFDNDFSTDIEILENSKISIHSLSFQPIQNVLVINASNQQLEYNLTNSTVANAKIVLLENQVYTNVNFQDCLDDMTLKLNNSLELSGKQIGTQFTCIIGESTKKAEIGYKFSPLKNDDWFNIQNVVKAVGNSIKKDSDTEEANDASRLTSDHSFIKGCGVFRVRLRNIGANGSGNTEDNGFTLGLTETSPDKIVGDVINKRFGIKISRDTDPYQSILNNTYTTHAGITPENYLDTTLTNNDVMEISVSEGKIRGRIYRQSQADPDLLFEETLDRTKEYYPFLSFQGGADTAQANILRYNYDPVLYTATETQTINIVDTHSGFTSSPPQVPRNTSTIFRVDFPLELSEFLGFKQQTQIKLGTSVNLLGDLLFTATLVNDSFIVEMKNIDLESYDGFDKNGMRKNILAIIPKSDNNGIVEYEPNTPYYIDMNNTRKSIRNIRARILRGDLEPVQTAGLSVLTIMIKSSIEK